MQVDRQNHTNQLHFSKHQQNSVLLMVLSLGTSMELHHSCHWTWNCFTSFSIVWFMQQKKEKVPLIKQKECGFTYALLKGKRENSINKGETGRKRQSPPASNAQPPFRRRRHNQIKEKNKKRKNNFGEEA